ncbi:MAG TPA: ferredoxin [bacterium]|nr:ferredoxin [bacterium]
MAEAAVQLEEYFVTEDCIACDACCNDFPDIFKMNADHTRAIATEKSPVGKFNPWDIINDCPVDAIKLVNLPMPPKPEGEKKPAAPVAEVDNSDWLRRWEAVRDQLEPQWERMKRYGMASAVDEDKDRYVVRFDMPEKVPNHRLKFQWGLPDLMPDYKTSVQVDGNNVKIRAKLEDEKVRKLCGWVNSFPDGFLKELNFPVPIKSHRESYDPETRVLEVTLEKASPQ